MPHPPRRLLARSVLAGSLVACLASAVPVEPAEALDLPRAGAFPHEAFTEVLSKYVDTTGRVDYKGLLASRAALDGYVAYVGLVSPARNPDLFPTVSDSEAYYINGYNALAITGVIDRPGIKSVNDPGLGFFVTTRYTVGGERINLHDLENRVIRPAFHDPRLHFALNCQSVGCPRLPQAAYDPQKLEAELEAGAREFCTNPTKVYVDSAGAWHISQLFEWYKDDFSSSGGVVAFIDAHGGTLPANAKVEFIPYDWTLSAQPGRSP